MQTRDELRTQIQNQVRDAVRDATNAAREAAGDAGVAIAQERPALPPDFAVDVLRGEISATRELITELSSRLDRVSGAAGREALQTQLEGATERLARLESSLDQTLAGAESRGQASTTAPQIPEGVMDMARDSTYAFFITVAVIAIGLPLARAFARWLDRRGQQAGTPADVNPRLERIEQAVESVAIEVERISEGQRFTTKLLTERLALPAADLRPGWQSPLREAVPVRATGEE